MASRDTAETNFRAHRPSSLGAWQGQMPKDQATERKRRSMIVRAVAGVSFEYYDYVMFATFAPFFANQFFKNDDPIASTLNTLLVFALGFLMRPLGAMIAGRLADRFGRKPVMLTSLGFAATGCLAVALTPTYSAIGIYAVIVLVVARLLQGLAHGMESISAYIYTAETADQNHRARHSSAYPIAMNLGVMQATIFGVVLTSLFSDAEMHQWAWRIPFVIGAFYGLFILLLRRGVEETEAYKKSKTRPRSENDGYWKTVWTHKKIILMLLLIWSGMTTSSYTLQVGFSEYAISALKANSRDAFWAAFIAQSVYMLAVVFWARVSDRMGRKFNYTLGFTSLAICSFPLQFMLGPSLTQLAIPMTIGLVLWAAIASTELAFVNEQIPNRVRAQVMSIPSSFGAVIFGGTAPYLKTLAYAHASPYWFTFYYVILCLIALAVVRLLPETVGSDLT